MKKPSDLKCGDCLFYKANVKPGHKVCCMKEGIKAFSKAKPCYFPDITVISPNIETFAVLTQTFAAYTAKQRRILCSLLLSGGKYKREFPFGTKVYMTSDGKGEYLSDYISGYVLGYQGDYCIVCGSSNRKTIGRAFTAYVYPDTLLGYSDFAKIKHKLVKAGKINNPTCTRKRRITSIEGYEPPTLDFAPKQKQKKVRKDVYEKITTVLSY